MRNRLDQETSPYLLQHEDNPVHWQPWDSEALDRARQENKPILLSVGYAACHWCHVMAHESFENEDTAALMNELFVNIKVDREERPDIDQIYQAALTMLGQSGGWPLTMFLTPAGEPFWGGTYFPPHSQYGRPGFQDVLRSVRNVFDKDKGSVEANRAALMQALVRHNEPKAGERPPVTPDLVRRIGQHLAREIDPVHGGIKGAPKFPQVPILELVWRSHLAAGDDDAAREMGDLIVTSLERMCQGGIYDHLGGGFCRYSTDEQWLVPHFEKMLYDNAQLIDLLTLVHGHTPLPLFAERVRETADWVLREMTADGGAFAASLDADTDGVEGRFYVWDSAEIDEVLGPDATLFKAVYGVEQGGNWEGVTILNRLAGPQRLDAEEETLRKDCRRRLLERRKTRTRPGKDDKVLADWNGLMIAALVGAGLHFSQPDWIKAASAAYDFIAIHSGSYGGRLAHSFRAGKVGAAGLLDDYAQMARAALTLYGALGSKKYLRDAEGWAEFASEHFQDKAAGGFYLTSDDAENLIVRTRSANDGPLPSGNAVMLEVLTKLFYLTGRDKYRFAADKLASSFAVELGHNFFPLAGFLNGLDLIMNPVQIVIIGKRGDKATEALIGATHAIGIPNRIMSVVKKSASLPKGHPARGKEMKEGRPTAYVCVGTSCSLPVTDAKALRRALTRD